MTDVVVVGSGAAGGWAALTLARHGLDVLVLEAGPPVAGDHRVDRAAHLARRQPIQSRCSAYDPANAHLFVDDLDNPYQTPPESGFQWYRSRHLGGRLLLWAGVCLRMSPRELRTWPVRYEQLAGYYRRVERLMHVSGGGEDCPAAPAPEAATYQPPTPGEQRLAEAVAAGWPGRQVLSCRTARAPAGTVLGAALATGRVRIRTDAVVAHLEVDAAGSRAVAAVFVDRTTLARHRVPARGFVLCASTIETVRILLNSRSRHHPDGLGNDADRLGRYLLDHVAGVSISGTVPGCQPPRPLAEPGFVPVCHIPDFTGPADGLPGGYGITAFVPEAMPANQHSAAWARSAEPGTAAFRMWAAGEVPPRPDNRVTLADRCDAYGVPQVCIDLRYGPAEVALAAHQIRSMREMAHAAGFTVTAAQPQPLPPGSSVHELGGAAMGTSPQHSVVDPDQRLWRVPNVAVGDGACFPTAGWQNPTLTIMALAARAADRLAAGFARGEL